MYKVVYLIIVTMVFNFMFIPTAKNDINDLQKRKIKVAMNLSSKAIVNSIQADEENYDTLSHGYDLHDEDAVIIDKEKLVREFEDVLYKNVFDSLSFSEYLRKIPLLILSYGDRFYYAEMQLYTENGLPTKKIEDYKIKYVWSPAIYYTTVDVNNRLIYTNLRDETSYYYNKIGGIERKVTVNNTMLVVDGKVLTKDIRDKIVIDKINSVVYQKTLNPLEENYGFKINIRESGFEEKDLSGMNFDEKEKYYKSLFEKSNFNVLEGITFFIIYSSDDRFYIRDQKVLYKNYQSTGYTLTNRY